MTEEAKPHLQEAINHISEAFDILRRADMQDDRKAIESIARAIPVMVTACDCIQDCINAIGKAHRPKQPASVDEKK